MSVVANVAVNLDARNAAQNLRRLDAGVQKTQNSFEKLRGVATKLAGAFAVFEASKFVFAKTAELETQAKSLEVLTGSTEKATRIIKELQQIGKVTPFTSSELIDSAKRLNAFGVETEKVVETTKRLADVSGASGAELSGLVTAFGQVIAKGKLQGEELLQFQERGVALQGELRRLYKLSGEEFQDALSKGKISAEAVEVAIKNLTDAGGKYANGAVAQSDTLSGKLSTLQDNIETLARTIGQVLSPVIKAVFDQAIQALDAVNRLLASGRGGGFTRSIGQIGTQLTFGASSDAVKNAENLLKQISSQKNKVGIEQNLQALEQLGRALKRIRPGDVNAEKAVQLQGKILELRQQNIKALESLPKAASIGAVEVPKLLGGTKPTGVSGVRGARDTSAEDLQRRRDLGADLLQQQNRQLALLIEQDPLQRELLKIDFQRLDLQERAKQAAADQKNEILQTIEAVKSAEAGAAIGKSLAEGAIGLSGLQERVRGGFAQGAAIDQQIQKANDEAKIFKQTLDGIGQVLGSTLRSGIEGLISGTAKLNDVLSGVLKQIGSLLISAGFNALGNSGGGIGKVFSFLGFGKRANGGPVRPGGTYLVGERGPELLQMGPQGGFVQSNRSEAMRRYQGGGGGLGSGTMTVNYNVTEINGMKFVTEEQFRSGLDQAAQKGASMGKTMTINTLKNSRSQRSRIGL